jgi:hypothetical protein
LAACSQPPAARQAPVSEPEPQPTAAIDPEPAPADDRFAWKGWTDCEPPAPAEFLIYDSDRGLVAVHADTLASRIVAPAVLVAAIDTLHRVVWLSVRGENAGLWTLSLDAPCQPPRAALVGIEPGDFGVSFGPGSTGLSLSTNCASHQLAWDMGDPDMRYRPISAAPPDNLVVNRGYVDELATLGPGTPYPRPPASAPLGTTGKVLVTGEPDPDTGNTPCRVRDRSGKLAPFGPDGQCFGTTLVHTHAGGSRWLYGDQVCDASGCKTWSGSEYSGVVGWWTPGVIYEFAQVIEGC